MEKIDCKITKEFHIAYFDVSGVRIELFNRAIISVIFHCEDGEKIYKEVVLMGDVYKQWGDDDSFITDYIHENAHLILENAHL